MMVMVVVCRVAAARLSLEQELELLKTEQTSLHYALQVILKLSSKTEF